MRGDSSDDEHEFSDAELARRSWTPINEAGLQTNSQNLQT